MRKTILMAMAACIAAPGAAQTVDMSAGTGVAIVRDGTGHALRLGCTAGEAPAWTCTGRVGPATTQAVERSITGFYALIGFTPRVHLTAGRGGAMSGTLRVQIDGGDEVLRCNVGRTGPNGSTLRWQCTRA